MAEDGSQAKREKNLRIQEKVKAEILSTEETYVHGLNTLIQVYIVPLRKMCKDAMRAGKAPPLEKKELNVLFSNIETIYAVNMQFIEDVRSAMSGEEKDSESEGKSLGKIFLDFAPYFKMYTEYVGNHDRATDLLTGIQKNGSRKYNAFKEFLKKKSVPIAQLLILPIQRVPRYRLLLQELVKRTQEDDPDYEKRSNALELIKKSANHINEAVKRMDSIRKVRQVQEKFLGQPAFVSPSRIFIQEARLAKMSDGDRYRQKYQFFLFNDLFLYADYRPLTKKYKVHWSADINANFDLKHLPNDESSRYKFQFEIVTPDKSFKMVFKALETFTQWKTLLLRCIEERKNQINFRPKARTAKSLLRLQTKPPRPPRPSEDGVRLLFSLYNRIERARKLVNDRRNAPPSQCARVLFDYAAQDASELTLREGGVVEILSTESEAGSEWWRGECDGKTGVFPYNYVKTFQRCWFKAVCEYKAGGDSELQLLKDDVLKVERMMTNGWWYAKSLRSQSYGWIPANYVEECDRNYHMPKTRELAQPKSAKGGESRRTKSMAGIRGAVVAKAAGDAKQGGDGEVGAASGKPNSPISRERSASLGSGRQPRKAGTAAPEGEEKPVPPPLPVGGLVRKPPPVPKT